MCLITVLPKGTDKYSTLIMDAIHNGFISNRNGSGFGFISNSSPEYEAGFCKGFFTEEEFLEVYKMWEFKKEDIVVIHHRVSTQGKINTDNTHPFIVTDSLEEICKDTQNFTKKPLIFHNGIFHFSKIYPSHIGQSDTFQFANNFLFDPEYPDNLKLFLENPEKFSEVFKSVYGWSRLAILDPTDENCPLKMSGNFLTEDGYFFSNGGYENYRIVNRGGIETITVEEEDVIIEDIDAVIIEENSSTKITEVSHTPETTTYRFSMEIPIGFTPTAIPEKISLSSRNKTSTFKKSSNFSSNSKSILNNYRPNVRLNRDHIMYKTLQEFTSGLDIVVTPFNYRQLSAVGIKNEGYVTNGDVFKIIKPVADRSSSILQLTLDETCVENTAFRIGSGYVVSNDMTDEANSGRIILLPKSFSADGKILIEVYKDYTALITRFGLSKSSYKRFKNIIYRNKSKVCIKIETLGEISLEALELYIDQYEYRTNKDFLSYYWAYDLPLELPESSRYDDDDHDDYGDRLNNIINPFKRPASHTNLLN